MKSKSLLLLLTWLALTCVALTTPARAQNTVPGIPTNVQAAAGNGQAAVSFAAPASNGGSPITGYTVTSFPGGITGSGTGSPIIVQGLTNGVPYTFTVSATNAIGSGQTSASSGSVSPSATFLANLAGNWNLNNFLTGSGVQQWWERDKVTISADGSVIGSGTDSTGKSVTYTGTLWLFPYGMWPMLGSNPNPDSLCQVDLNNTLFTCLENWADGSTQFIAGTKNAASYSTSDITGTWEGNFLFLGPTNGWINETETVYPDGEFTGTQTPSDGSTITTSGTLSISSTGAIKNASDATYESFLNSGMTVEFGTSGAATVAEDAQLMVFTRTAGSYSLTDLAGFWEGNQLSTDANWTRMSLQINPDGTFTESDVSMDGTTGSESGSLSFESLSSIAGLVTCSPGCGENAAISQLVMDAGKTLMVGTQTGGTGAYSITILTKTAEVPGAPTTVNAKAGNGLATVSFNAPVSDGGSPILSYTITSDPGGYTASGTASPITVEGLTNGTRYFFTVTATNAAGQSTPSSQSNTVTPNTKPTPPAAPTNVIATPANGQASVSFSAPVSDGGSPILSYTATSNPGNIRARSLGNVIKPITVKGLANGKPYIFTVTATNKIGAGPSSAPSIPVTPASLPGPPPGVSAKAGNGQALVRFTAPGDGGSEITSYTVTSNPEGLTGSGTTSPITVSGLNDGTQYVFKVTATNAIGTGKPSVNSNRVTPATVPDPPVNVAETAGKSNGTVIVTFTPPASNGGSIVTYYTVTDTVDSNITKRGTSSPIIMTGLKSGIAYTFEVTATNVMGTGQATTSSNPAAPN